MRTLQSIKSQIQNHNTLIKKQGTSSWESPSNIALVKYWGKTGNQIPMNPSVSLTLKNSKTTTKIKWNASGSGKVSSFLFEGKPADSSFCEKLETALDKMSAVLPWIKTVDYEMDSSNSFPHSAGIASSASSMSALALCLLESFSEATDFSFEEGEFLILASELARLGSGSACRSLFPLCAAWGEDSELESSDLYANEVKGNDDFYKSIHNAILIIDDEKKNTSSTAGHALMKNHPYRDVRVSQAKNNYKNAIKFLKLGDFKNLGPIIEEEALSLHSLMMTSDPSFILMKPNTLKAIDHIRAFRKESGLDLFFTLDAGPNIHLLYLEKDKNSVESFVDSKLKPLCKNSTIIFDKTGKGPVKVAHA